jgi:hypothetical protein
MSTRITPLRRFEKYGCQSSDRKLDAFPAHRGQLGVEFDRAGHLLGTGDRGQGKRSAGDGGSSEEPAAAQGVRLVGHGQKLRHNAS